MTGLQLSGNKVRKLEFLLSEAIELGHDSIITIGGIQSNHARATAVAARLLGLECHLILRNSRVLAESDPGLRGNIMVDRLSGATIHQARTLLGGQALQILLRSSRFRSCHYHAAKSRQTTNSSKWLRSRTLWQCLSVAQVIKEEYQKVGSKALVDQMATQLQETGLNPYCIGVGGSTPLGVACCFCHTNSNASYMASHNLCIRNIGLIRRHIPCATMLYNLFLP